MFTASIGVKTFVETDIRALVPSDDRTGMIRDVTRGRPSSQQLLILLRVGEIGRRPKAIGRIVGRSPTLGRQLAAMTLPNHDT